METSLGADSDFTLVVLKGPARKILIAKYWLTYRLELRKREMFRIIFVKTLR